MFDNRHHFRWNAEEEASWVDRVESLRLTPSAQTVRQTLFIRATHHTDAAPDDGQRHTTYYPQSGRDHRGPLDPLGHDD